VTSLTLPNYEQLKTEISEQVDAEMSPARCFFLVKKYLAFFQDNHLQFYCQRQKEIDEESAAQVKAFKESGLFRSRERVLLDTIEAKRYLLQSSDSIEGIYKNEVYEIIVTKNQNNFHDYLGYINQSKTSLWEPGQVKLEVKQLGLNTFQTVLYLRNHSFELRKIENENPVIAAFGVKKVFPPQSVRPKSKFENFSFPPAGNWFQFKSLNDSTGYLHIKTFDGSLKRRFDSAYHAIKPTLESKRNLIIDIRGNGGGSDACWRFLSTYLYTQPFDYDITEFLCTEEIIKRNEEYLQQMEARKKDYGWGAIKFQKIKLRKMRNTPSGTFIPFSKMIPWWARPFVNVKTEKQRKVYPSPERIVVMTNRNTASSAEGLLLDAMKSKKVITFGENSGGFITFGDIRSVTTPNRFVLHSATQRTRNRFQYERIGIPPKIQAIKNEDWIQQAIKLFQNWPQKN
ncbi:MAG: S41 family peptidase, partial [Cytophagales bacterium]